jgi:hypothetical protein
MNQKKHKNNQFLSPPPMLLLNPFPWKVIFHAIYPELCHFAGGSIDAEKIYILYLYLSKDITPEKEGTTFWNWQE